MNHIKESLQRLGKIRAYVIGLLVIMFAAGSAVTPTSVSAAVQLGTQVMPLSYGGYYVLFPGKLAPYFKSGKLMVPIRAFSSAIGADLLYDALTNSVTVSLLDRSVGKIKAGQLEAEFNGETKDSLGIAPEIKDGILFVPASPILEGLKTFRWETQFNNVNKLTLGIGARKGEEWAKPEADRALTPYPVETTAHPYPLYPFKLTQAQSGKEFRLTLGVQNTSGFVIPKGNAELELVSVDRKGNSYYQTLKGPDALTSKAALLSFSVSIPTEAEYVIFRSRTLRAE
ncbi:copper amine oxidase N-terminal domain-containing protein [Paenibacillus sp. G2S3]|uniref:copper amine oxidase N-terminal domain-containing protein n=1 Tax=Paenibacillus sp. G2S3 TaxID=3047872 RepID=UPI0024C165F9|nr:copper amine oxidase N-terminal domain-containing protein [Paenibacillus sp. G2S3]WHY18845.1 copper amine oxidase N-terminal domain-containing protein [Paenibacillus sp. G2S3]